ncbi:MAG: hypothetical protein RSG52_11485 [Terrisporobacter sp.]|uniref:hypothetical protein n=1 Tax=Terrisporobacter sp. TaxID=1965305 RepID=UPI002FC8B646
MEWILSMSITQIVIGVILIFVCKISKNSNSRNMIKIIGYINIFLGITTLIIQSINNQLSIVTMLIFSISIIITFVYIGVVLINSAKDSNENNKKIVFVVIISILILNPLANKIITKINLEYMKSNRSIKVGEEFLIYKNDDSQGNETVSMTINKIVKDGPDIVIYFDLKYEGDRDIPLVGDKLNFSDLCTFKTNLSSKITKDVEEDEFNVEEDVDSDMVYTEYTKKLDKVIKPGTKIKNLTQFVIGIYKDDKGIPIKDTDIIIESGIMTNQKMKRYILLK